MIRIEKTTQNAALMFAPALMVLVATDPSRGQCCQSASPSSPAELHAPAGAAAGQSCCSQTQRTTDPTTTAATTTGNLSFLQRPDVAWMLNAIERMTAEISRIVEQMTFADYSTQWSSWCSGNRGGDSKPCATKCCKKPCNGQGAKPAEKSKNCG